MDKVIVEPPSPGHTGKPLAHGNDLGAQKDMARTKKDSLISTMKPYLHNDLVQPRSKPKKKTQVETFPGVFEPASYERFLTLSVENGNICDSNIFEVHRNVVNCLGKEPKISQDGKSILIEVESQEESEKLQAMQDIKGMKVNCTPHKSLNQCKGVIYSRDLLNYSEETLKRELEDQSVIDVRRILKKENGIVYPTPLLILTFDLLELPSILKAAWLRIKIRPYIPSPRRCFHCQMFGHLNTNCRKKMKGEPEICANCGNEIHGECDRDAQCANCGGNHATYNKTCDRYLFEKEVLTLKTKEKISFSEAKAKAMPMFNAQIFTYSSSVKKQRNYQKTVSRSQEVNKEPVTPKVKPNQSSRTSGNQSTSSKRRLSGDEVIPPMPKSNRFEILGDEMDSDKLDLVHNSPMESESNVSHSDKEDSSASLNVVQAEVHAPPCSLEQENTFPSVGGLEDSPSAPSGEIGSPVPPEGLDTGSATSDRADTIVVTSSKEVTRPPQSLLGGPVSGPPPSEGQNDHSDASRRPVPTAGSPLKTKTKKSPVIPPVVLGGSAAGVSKHAKGSPVNTAANRVTLQRASQKKKVVERNPSKKKNGAN